MSTNSGNPFYLIGEGIVIDIVLKNMRVPRAFRLSRFRHQELVHHPRIQRPRQGEDSGYPSDASDELHGPLDVKREAHIFDTLLFDHHNPTVFQSGDHTWGCIRNPDLPFSVATQITPVALGAVRICSRLLSAYPVAWHLKIEEGLQSADVWVVLTAPKGKLVMNHYLALNQAEKYHPNLIVGGRAEQHVQFILSNHRGEVSDTRTTMWKRIPRESQI